MKDLFNTIYKIANVLVKLIPTILSLIEDFADDGALNHTNKRFKRDREAPLPPLDEYENQD